MTTLCQLLVAIVLAESLALSASEASGPQPGQIKNLVAFGDSYTDIVSCFHLSSLERHESNRSRYYVLTFTAHFRPPERA